MNPATLLQHLLYVIRPAIRLLDGTAVALAAALASISIAPSASAQDNILAEAKATNDHGGFWSYLTWYHRDFVAQPSATLAVAHKYNWIAGSGLVTKLSRAYSEASFAWSRYPFEGHWHHCGWAIARVWQAKFSAHRQTPVFFNDNGPAGWNSATPCVPPDPCDCDCWTQSSSTGSGDSQMSMLAVDSGTMFLGSAALRANGERQLALFTVEVVDSRNQAVVFRGSAELSQQYGQLARLRLLGDMANVPLQVNHTPVGSVVDLAAINLTFATLPLEFARFSVDGEAIGTGGWEIHDNGPIVTHPGGGSGGADVSAVETAPPMSFSIYGFGADQASSQSVADQFTVCGEQRIDELEFCAYQPNAIGPTLTGVFARIWDRDPRVPGAAVVWGDLATNLMPAAPAGEFVAYRAPITSLASTARPIHAIRVPVPAVTPLHLGPGTYWMEFQLTGSASSGLFVPPVTRLGVGQTGNAIQNASGVWQALSNSASGPPAGVALPFKFLGQATRCEMMPVMDIGPGCPGSLGIPVLTATPPHVGQLETITCNRVPPNMPVLTMVGFGNTSWNGAPLPVSLDGFGMPGCAAHISPDVVLMSIAGGFESTLSFPIPNDPQLVGMVLDVQAFVVDPGINPAGAVVSNALRLGVGQ